MAAKKRKIINFRQVKIAEIWERDPAQNQKQIAEILQSEFGLSASQATISRDLKALDQRHISQSVAVVDAVKAQLVEEYEFIYQQAINAWLKSLADKQITVIESIETGDSENSRAKASEKTEGQSGNPALLAQAQAALKSIREMYGLDAPLKVDWREQLPEGMDADSVQRQFIELMMAAANEDTGD